jgi:hypothetical protein
MITHWTTRANERIAIAAMSDQHILNAIALIERKRAQLDDDMAQSFGFAAGCRGEMASYYADQGADDASNALASYVQRSEPALTALRTEVRRRGIA